MISLNTVCFTYFQVNDFSDSDMWCINGDRSDGDETLVNTTHHGKAEEERKSEKSVDETDSIDDSAENLTVDDCLKSSEDVSPEALSTKIVESADSTEDAKNTKMILEEYQKEIEKMKVVRDKEKEDVKRQINSAQKRSTELEKKLAQSIEKSEQLNAKVKQLEENQKKIQEQVKSIQTIKYSTIEKNIVHDFLLPKHKLILDYLRKKTTLDESLIERIPRITFDLKQNTCTVIVVGVRAHNTGFKDILRKIFTLLNMKQRTIDFYQRRLNWITNSIIQILFKVKSSDQHWKQYRKFLNELLKEKNTKYAIQFKNFIGEKVLELTESFVLGESEPPRIALRDATNFFMTQNSFINEIEGMKQQALDKFIELNISFQQLKFAKRPTKHSINTLKYFIGKIKRIFREDNQYIGHKLQHFRLIPELLERLMIYYCCFTIQLPLYESSRELLANVRRDTVVTISTSTGSGMNFVMYCIISS